jgi:AraC-like DNA-binding protein
VFDLDAASFRHGEREESASGKCSAFPPTAAWEFICCRDGHVVVEMDGIRLDLPALHVLVCPPNTRRIERVTSLIPANLIRARVAMPASDVDEARLVVPDQQGHLRFFTNNMVSEYTRQGVTPLLHAYLRTFLLSCERLLETSQAPVDVAHMAKMYLKKHYMEPLTLDMVANHLGVSKSTLVHRFKANLGISVMAYLRRYRVEMGIQLLTTTDKPVNEVARLVGFRDPLYFTRLIRQQTGSPPTTLRAQGIPEQDYQAPIIDQPAAYPC